MEWTDLKEKKVTTTVMMAKKEVTEPIETLQEPEKPTVPYEDVNPFAFSDNETSAVDAAQHLITTDKEQIKLVTQISSPKAFAVGHMVSEWERQENAEELADLDENFITNLEKLECGRRGKDNRAKLYAEVLKAVRQQELDLEKATSAKLMGK